MGEAYKRKIENARVGYQVAVSLMCHEEQAIWLRCRTILIANGIIAATIGWALTSTELPSDAKCILLHTAAALGIILCILWWCVIARSYRKAYLYSRCAHILERDYLSDPVETLERNAEMSKLPRGKTKLDDDDIRISLPGRLIPIKTVPYFLCAIFFALYIALCVIGRSSL